MHWSPVFLNPRVVDLVEISLLEIWDYVWVGIVQKRALGCLPLSTEITLQRSGFKGVFDRTLSFDLDGRYCAVDILGFGGGHYLVEHVGAFCQHSVTMHEPVVNLHGALEPVVCWDKRRRRSGGAFATRRTVSIAVQTDYLNTT